MGQTRANIGRHVYIRINLRRAIDANNGRPDVARMQVVAALKHGRNSTGYLVGRCRRHLKLRIVLKDSKRTKRKVSPATSVDRRRKAQNKTHNVRIKLLPGRRERREAIAFKNFVKEGLGTVGGVKNP